MSPKIYPFKNAPGAILGFRKDGRPIHAIAGASEMIPEPSGITIVPPLEPPPVPPATPLAQAFTAEDVENARKQEKDKLYDRITKTDEVVKNLQAEQKKRLDAESKARKDAEDAAEAERLKLQSFEEKFAETTQSFEVKMAGLQEQVAQRDALLEAERQFQALQNYKNSRLSDPEVSGEIMPQLVDLVGGHSEAEIDASIARAIEKSEAILAEFQNHQQTVQQQAVIARQNARGTTVTAPPVGPMENQSGQMTFSAEDIKNMSIEDYAKVRPQLMEAASALRRS